MFKKKFNKNLLGIWRICLLLILIDLKFNFFRIEVFYVPKSICHISFDLFHQLKIFQHGLLCFFQPQRNKRSDSCWVLNYLVYSRLFWFACLLCFLVLDTHTRSQQQSQFFVYTQSSNNLQSYISPHRLRVWGYGRYHTLTSTAAGIVERERERGGYYMRLHSTRIHCGTSHFKDC